MGAVVAEDNIRAGNRILGLGGRCGEDIEWGEAAPILASASNLGWEEGAAWIEVRPRNTVEEEGGDLGGWEGLFLDLEKK